MSSSLTPVTVAFAAILSAGAVGCSKLGSAASSEANRTADAAPAAAVRAGDRVIVESAMATFVEGVVASVVRDRARIQLGTGGELSERSLSDLYVPSSSDVAPSGPATARPAPDDVKAIGASATLREGSYAVCRMPDAGWRGCRIESVGSAVKVVDDEAMTVDLPWRELLAPTPVTELNVRQRFERNARKRAFREGARSAGRPRVPSDWRPGMNERVIVEREGAWVGAQTKGWTKGRIRVQWEGDRRTFDALPSDVAPEPPVDFAPTVGTYVLARPPVGTRAWHVMRVESAGTASLELSDESGDRHPTALRDVMPLERGR